MLDYYGSVMITDSEIDTQLISRFREYNENYIENIIIIICFYYFALIITTYH